MNDSNRNNNEVEYCSRVIYCFQTKHKFQVFTGKGGRAEGVQSQHTTTDPPCIIITYL